ncbi:MAG: insulinase family protein, partial [Acidobacteriia bacterium]|nr:insulinase family protein [Terriglobia bacterium]
MVLALVSSAFCQTLPSGVQKGASLAGVTEYAFPNGLRVLLYPDDAQPKVTVNVTYLVGSRHEGYGETGMAHLLEHMNFIQSTNGRDIKKELADHGGSYNGSTSYDRTNFYETVPATDENLKWALGLEADRMVNIRQAKELLDKEMTVVRNEFERGENSPAGILEERVVATAYLWHNYGKSTIGSKEDIEKVPIDRLAAFYHKYYRPDNAVLVVAGRFDPANALAWVSQTLGAVPRPTAPLEATYTVEPPQDGERSVELRRVGTGKNIMMAYHGPSAAHPDAIALQVLSGIMNGAGGGRGGRGGGGGGATGRLRKALVDTQKAQSASMSFQLLHDPGFVLVSASLSKDQSIDEVRKIILQTIDGVVTEPPTQEEMNRVKTQMTRSLPLRMSDAQQFGLGLSEPIAQGDWRLLFLNNDRVKDVTPEDVVRVIKTYFKPSNRTVGVFIPDDQPDRTVIPNPPTFSSMLMNYKPNIVVQRGEAFDPAPANIEKRLERVKLANGMRLALLPKKTANGRVSAVIQLHFGDGKTLAGQRAAAQFAGSLLMMGTKNKTRQQIQDEFQKLNASVSVGGGGGGFAGGGRGGRGGGGGGGNIG